ADAPVAQPPGGLLLAEAGRAEELRDAGDGRRVAEAVDRARLDAGAALLVAVPLLPGVGAEALAGNGDDLPDRQPVLLREREVALVVRGHAHHGAVAVAHEDVVAHPHGHG